MPEELDLERLNAGTGFATPGATPDERLEVKLMNWADSEEGARALWAATKAALEADHHPLDRHRARWEILDPGEQHFNKVVAARIMRAALEACRG